MLKTALVIQNWARFLATLGIAVAMLGAPCRDCAPKEEPKAHCGHDCCPKPKPNHQSKPCSWMPAGFDAVEKSKESFSPGWDAGVLMPAPAESGALELEHVAAVVPDDRPPPLPPPSSLIPLRI